MNFDDAIKTHSRWKQRLAAYIEKPDHSLSSTELSNDRNCELGKWISGEGQRFANLAEFERMKRAHAVFHRAAGEIVTKADHGQKMTEEVALGGNSTYASASTTVVSAIMAMKHRANL